MNSYFVFYLIVALLSLNLAYGMTIDSPDHHDDHKCSHNHKNFKPEIVEVNEDLTAMSDDRMLQTATVYNNIRIIGNYDLLNNAPDEYQAYIQNELAPPVIDFFQNALKVKYPIIGNLSLRTTATTVCGMATPSFLFGVGIPADYIIFYDSVYDDTGSWVASSYACFLSAGSNRPLVATTQFNRALLKIATGNVLLQEKNTYLLIHEMMHTFGFSSSLYPYFLDDNGVQRTGHIKGGSLSGKPCIIIDVPQLTSRLRSFFGCSTLEGAYMENDGSDATSGSHFERRQFVFDSMTSGLIYELAVTQFSFALLEGSGWYIADYNYTDPYYFGQGEGCSFLNGTCANINSQFDEYCTGSSRGCTFVGRGGGSCTADSKSDGCKFQYPNIAYDCENPNTSSYVRLSGLQTFGRGLGSKCFEGNLSTSKSDTPSSFCFTSICQGSGLNTSLILQVGSKNVTCKAAGNVSVSGYYGQISCPDPLTFCSTVGKKFCSRNCMGRGTCLNGVCQCKPGYTGTDCGLLAS